MTSSRALLCLLLLFGSADAIGCAGRVNDNVWQPFAAWATATSIGKDVSESSWLFAIIESFHLTGLALLGGAVILVDFRLIGFVLGDEPLPKLAQSAEPWLLTGLAVSVISGLLLFFSEASKFYGHQFWDSAEAPFVYKMLFLLLAIVFTFTVRRKQLRVTGGVVTRPTLRDRFVGLTSLFLWLGVGVGGRAIGFY
jgi:hypothetical protein